jgi:hypothetical protein
MCVPPPFSSVRNFLIGAVSPRNSDELAAILAFDPKRKAEQG